MKRVQIVLADVVQNVDIIKEMLEEYTHFKGGAETTLALRKLQEAEFWLREAQAEINADEDSRL